MREAGIAGVALLLTLFALPSAGAASQHLAADLSFEGASWGGTFALAARDEGALNLTASETTPPFLVSWTAMDGFMVDRARVGTPLATGYYQREGTDNRSIESEAGAIEIICKPGCEVLLYARQGSEIHFTGEVAGPLVPTVSPHHYAAWSVGAADDNFYYEVPDDAVTVGGPALRATTASANGALGLFVDNATVKLTTSTGNYEWELGREREQIASSPVGPALTRIHDRFLVLTLEGASWTGDGSPVLLHAREPEGDFDGEIVARRVSGSLRVGRHAEALDDERLLVRGSLHLASIGGEPPLVLATEGDSRVTRVSMSGEVARVRVGERELVSAAQLPARQGMTVALIAAALVAIAWAIPWTALYSRIDRSRVLDNLKRRGILSALETEPGLTAPGLARTLGIARAVILHHLMVLESHKLLTMRRIGWERRYYLPENVPDAARLAATLFMADTTRRRIATALIDGTSTQTLLTERTGAPQRLVSYHLGKLEKHGLVSVREGRPREYAATSMLHHAMMEQGQREDAS